jgi:hypothetical protein
LFFSAAAAAGSKQQAAAMDHSSSSNNYLLTKEIREMLLQSGGGGGSRGGGGGGKHSKFRGVIRRKNRWEAHVWVKGKQKYLGGYTEEADAARAYDLAVIKIRGIGGGETNFPLSEHIADLKRFRADEATVDEFILTLREEAKRKNRHMREERESNQIAMLKRNLEIQQQGERPDPKRKRQEEEDGQEQQQYQQLPDKLLQRMSTKDILGKYLEGTRRDREMRSGGLEQQMRLKPNAQQQQQQQQYSYSYPIAPAAAGQAAGASSLESPHTVLPLMLPVQTTYLANTITIANTSNSPPQALKTIQTIQTENDFLQRQLEESQKMYAEALTVQQQRSGQQQPQVLSTTTLQFSREASSQSLWSDWRP